MRSIFAVVLLLGLAGPARAPGCRPAPSGGRRAAVTVGFGNDLGWLGAMGEKYFAGGRKSLFAGIGYLPEIDDGEEVSALRTRVRRRGARVHGR